jgi:hypothetical protein
MSKLALEGPPWGEFVDEDEAFVREQGGSMGSGLLGGWSAANLGGYFISPPDPELRSQVRAIAREVVEDLPRADRARGLTPPRESRRG